MNKLDFNNLSIKLDLIKILDQNKFPHKKERNQNQNENPNIRSSKKTKVV